VSAGDRGAGIAKIAPTVLRGRFVTLEPLDAERDAAALFAGTPEGCFEYFLDWPAEWTLEAFKAWLSARAHGLTGQTFVVRDARGAAVGSSSLFVVDAAHRGLEIGFTWYTEAARGTAVNPESKLLLLAHAFDGHGAVRVQLKCDARNARSRAAIAKLGAVYEGTLRKHRVLQNGYVRDTAYFSIVAEEWPGVRAGLEARVAKFAR
jgi:RimJ/RimL family protein N-acetyltransferase